MPLLSICVNGEFSETANTEKLRVFCHFRYSSMKEAYESEPVHSSD